MGDTVGAADDRGRSAQGRRDSEAAASIPPPVTDDTLALSDGRSLGYAEYGPTDGFPLVFCHGTPGSRYTRHPDPSLLEHHGIRQITVDRPGYGRSSPQPGRDLLDWAGDVQTVADSLGLEEFAVAGLSGGGPHALVCGVELADRVTSIALLNGIGPVRAPRATDGMELRNRLMLQVNRLPVIPRVMTWLQVRKIRNDPDVALDGFAARFADVDAQVLKRPAVRAMFRQDFQAAVQQGPSGWVRDGRIFSRSWGFALTDLSVPVDLWHGELDTNVPLPMATFMREEIPSCTAHIYPDEGHLLVFDHWDEILSTLVDHRPSSNP